MDNKKKLDALTSLRFFAAALIVAFHTGAILGIGDISKVIPASQAVSFFFVLSGYILAYAYPDLSKPGSVRKFYVARVARVWPLHIATIFIWIFLIYKLNPAPLLWEHGIYRTIATVFMVQSWVPIEIWATSINGVSWSISTEIFFYLLFPLIAKRFTSRWKQILAVELIIISAILLISNLFPNKNPYGISASGLMYFFPPTRLLEFTVGIGLFHLTQSFKISDNALSKSQWTVVEVSALLLTYVTMMATKSHAIGNLFGQSVSYYVSTAGSFPAFAVLIGIFSFGKGHISSILKTRPLVFLGELSFALYLVHYAVVVYFKQYTNPLSYDWTSYCLIWAISISGAWILSSTVEGPFRKILINVLADSPVMAKKRKAFVYRTFQAALAASVIGFGFYATPKVLDYAYPPVAIFSTPANLDVAKYSNGVSITRFEILVRRDKSLYAKIQFKAIEAGELNSTVAIHLNDKDGKILFNVGAIVLNSQFTTADRLQAEASIELSPNQYFSTSSIGIAVFNDPQVLFSVESPNYDWGRTRAIIFAQPKAQPQSEVIVEPLSSDAAVVGPKQIDGNS
ncbi:acyltransferase family protein [Pseudomonas nunensis]|uniref:Acyltransferase n=1 Tax=Pseudomonas nunensis TaxID=2961896 RepID=A0ABY5E7S3_9PSED|nr:acyltransferase [Pseudomonas nunensis]KPN91592.1 hypothetical protein AL066_15075 [Pseudomonas nunensis]MCL5229719.1 acyltransferase [Pseudomonas nunensis]UTO11794.1 acyltransferase [Pseudomonas nunensis]